MDNYKSLLMETISKEDLVSKPAKIKRAGKLKEDLLPDEVYNTLVRKSKKTYTVGVYSTLPGPGWHYEINTEYGVYAKVPDDEGFIAHWFLQGLPQESEEKMENMAHYLIDEYDCREVSLDEYKRIVNGKNESLKDTKEKEMTALVRKPDGNLKVMHDDWYKNQKDFAEELRANGFKVLKVWYGYKSDAEADEWEMLHRKTNESLYGSKSLKEDTVKTSDGKWTNKGKEGTHGKFKTKKQADAQRKAMFANGYREGLKERYADDAVVLTAPLRKKLNKICQKYSGFRLPEQIAPMWEELYDLGIEVLIQGYPTNIAPGAKSWTVPFKLNGETVENSRFVYSVYEGSEGRRNDYNMYFS